MLPRLYYSKSSQIDNTFLKCYAIEARFRGYRYKVSHPLPQRLKFLTKQAFQNV
nr:MAG TPA: hypothetical protein [Caudoviricetes sp.]